MNFSKIIIAVDGYSSCGKSTLAKQLAKALNYIYIDSGAMYRAVTLYCLRKNIDVNNAAAVINALPNIHIDFRRNAQGDNECYLNGDNVEAHIRSQSVADNVSEVSLIKEVRQFLVQKQQEMGQARGIVMDGRDIGTVVFPDAELKVFLTADLHTRTQRRYEELLSKGIMTTLEEVSQNLQHRDHLDTHRQESPLYRAKDAILLDNTLLTREKQFQMVFNMAQRIIAESTTTEQIN